MQICANEDAHWTYVNKLEISLIACRPMGSFLGELVGRQHIARRLSFGLR